MRTFISGGYKFFTLMPGERAPNPYEKGDFGGAYLIWQRKSGMWDARQFVNGKWVEFTDRQFDTDNQALNNAYEHYLAYQDSMYRR